jgi:hypothetical protein
MVHGRGAAMAQPDFWSWVTTEKKNQKLSFVMMAEKGRARGFQFDPSSIKKAMSNNSRPSKEMLGLITVIALQRPLIDQRRRVDITLG